MRSAVAILLLVLGCASRDASIDGHFFDCAAGQALSVDVALNAPGVALENTTDHFTMIVDVGNNSHGDVVVSAIRVEPVQDASSRYVIERSYRKFGRVLAGGESHAFELPIMGRAVAATSTTLNASSAVGAIVSVYLGTGDTYRCELHAPGPR